MRWFFDCTPRLEQQSFRPCLECMPVGEHGLLLAFHSIFPFERFASRHSFDRYLRIISFFCFAIRVVSFVPLIVQLVSSPFNDVIFSQQFISLICWVRCYLKVVIRLFTFFSKEIFSAVSWCECNLSDCCIFRMRLRLSTNAARRYSFNLWFQARNCLLIVIRFQFACARELSDLFFFFFCAVVVLIRFGLQSLQIVFLELRVSAGPTFIGTTYFPCSHPRDNCRTENKSIEQDLCAPNELRTEMHFMSWDK